MSISFDDNTDSTKLDSNDYLEPDPYVDICKEVDEDEPDSVSFEGDVGLKRHGADEKEEEE